MILTTFPSDFYTTGKILMSFRKIVSGIKTSFQILVSQFGFLPQGSFQIPAAFWQSGTLKYQGMSINDEFWYLSARYDILTQ